MPVQYKGGLMQEHNAVRNNAGFFDVSHMGQVRFYGKDSEAFLKRMTVIDFKKLKPGNGGLSLITNEDGCIKDDTVITKMDDHIYMVINAGCKNKDLHHFNHYLNTEWMNKDIKMVYSEEDALIAVQGPKAASIVEKLTGVDLKSQLFM
jgi:aminomethyltransferase